MPRQEKFKVSGKSVNDLVNLSATQIANMNRTELSHVVSRLSSAANKRLKRFEKAGSSTPATRWVEKTGGKFSVKDKDIQQLRSEYIRVKGFLGSETGTRKGYHNFLQRIKKSFAESGVDIKGKSDKEIEGFIDQLTRIYDWLADRNPFISEKPFRYVIQAKTAQYIAQGNLSESAIKRRMNKFVKQTYEQMQDSSQQDIDNFFDLSDDDFGGIFGR